MSQYFSLSETQQELTAILRGDSRTWAETALLLDSVELHEIWREDSGSFTEWLNQCAAQLKKTKSILWRYLTAGRYYSGLQKKMLALNIQLPDLKNLPDQISPENLELLSKIERVAPYEMVQNLSKRVVSGEATRAELRAAWTIFRPVLAGQTARGKRDAPKYDSTVHSQRHTLMEAEIFSALSNKRGDLIHSGTNDFYKVFTHFEPTLRGSGNKFVMFDAVVATGHKLKSQLTLHGIVVIGTPMYSQTCETLETLMQYCDFMWVVTRDTLLNEVIANIPKGIGVSVIHNSAYLQVVCPPSRSINSGIKCCELYKSLLLKALNE
ncbi:hypothetical protein [Gallionella capsiferriformans]|uniref:Uncharacterized protein n=1 Tax=Gallionella capsiferriformans (strain ES-2) TaxID=395494 RepID=D9SFG2_GALCS|nr:hypothetical protein [Gallionella capsiferriformans]ADL55259.1 hypothetical protein Galf_1231 [Gallionella capsiferriformans ES-2]